jgi:hypothetical protein
MESTPRPPVYPTPVNGRPTFLTILCVLTFLSCAAGLFNAISSYSGADMAAEIGQEALEKAQDQVQDQDGGAFADRIIGSISGSLTPERIRQSAIANLIYNLLALAGALLMWNLRRVGFYVYVAGVLVAIIAPFFIYGGLMGGFASAGTAFVSVIFVVLYALNLKYMR